jgi:hypothetical protein
MFTNIKLQNKTGTLVEKSRERIMELNIKVYEISLYYRKASSL